MIASYKKLQINIKEETMKKDVSMNKMGIVPVKKLMLGMGDTINDATSSL